MSKHKLKITLSFFLTAAIVLGSFFIFSSLYQITKSDHSLAQALDNIVFDVDGGMIRAEIVRTKDALRRGLSGRESLDVDSGMLFVFERSGRHSIWMKEMKFSIDIIWLGEYFEIVDSRERVSPETYPEVFYPSRDALYVLEVYAGTVEKYGLKTGNRLSKR